MLGNFCIQVASEDVRDNKINLESCPVSMEVA